MRTNPMLLLLKVPFGLIRPQLMLPFINDTLLDKNNMLLGRMQPSSVSGDKQHGVCAHDALAEDSNYHNWYASPGCTAAEQWAFLHTSTCRRWAGKPQQTTTAMSGDAFMPG